MSTLPRLAVVSYLYGHKLSPRGARTHALVGDLRKDWKIEVIAGPTGLRQSERARYPSSLQRAMTAVSRDLLIDGRELWSKRRFSFWKPEADLALLIGYPYSPIIEAARRLFRRRIPYVVDVGDPWVLTGTDDPLCKRTARIRARHAERRLWERAAGAIVTTAGQADALRRLFPDISILIRPNGYQHVWPTDGDFAELPRRPAPGQALRLVHFGRMYLPRVNIAPLLLQLAQSECWPSVEIAQYGDDAEGVLQDLPSGVTVRIHDPVPWRDAVSIARGFDLALAVGNQDPSLLPSKVIEYLTLPIPRLAIIGEGKQSIRDYVRDKPGWLVISIEELRPDLRIATHRSRHWPAESLTPPESESWPRVTQEVGAFLKQCHGSARLL